jgi:predicted alpha-1,2-mannosidase
MRRLLGTGLATLALVAAGTTSMLTTGLLARRSGPRLATEAVPLGQIAAQARWIRSLQQPDGAITEAPYPSWAPSLSIDPYVANYAALGLARAALLTHSSADAQAAWSWLAFYARHEQPGTGYVTDYTLANQPGAQAVSTGSEDSTDAYAGTFLVAAWAAEQLPGAGAESSWLAPAVDGAISAILSTQDLDGLTYAKPSYHAALLMDVAESYGGLVAGAELASALGQPAEAASATTAAAEMEAGAEQTLWDATTGGFDWGADSLGGNVTDWGTRYPDAEANAWAVGYGLATPSEEASILSNLEASQPSFDAYSSGGAFPIAIWALWAAGDGATAAQAASTMAAAAGGAGWPWPWTVADMGELIVAESGGLSRGGVSSGAPGPSAAPAPGQAGTSSAGGSTASGGAASGADVVSLVNPMVGTGDQGNTTPAAAAPFGMIEWGPASANRPVGNYSAGEPVVGLSLTDAPGAGCKVFGDVPILPLSGALPSDPTSATEPLAGEQASPGQWSATLGSVGVSLAVTTRTGIADLRFPAGAPALVLIKAGDSLAGNSAASVSVVGNDEVTGSATSGDFCGQKHSHYTVYFALQSEQPFSSSGVWQASGAGAGAWIGFGTPSSPETVKVRVGISFVSVAGAEANLAAGEHGWSEKAVASATAAEWNQLLDRVQVGGGSPAEARLFYSLLYQSMLAPETFSDANGSYLGFDGQLHQLPAGGTQYSEISGWDIQNSEFPLLAMLVPHRAAEMAESLVRDARQGGWLPKWPLGASYTGVMEGDPADVILADAVAFGATDGLHEHEALADMLKGSNDPQSYSPSDLGQGWYMERFGGSAFNQLGYVPGDTSLTLQYAMDDAAIATVASALGESATAAAQLQRSSAWTSVYDSAAGWVEPRSSGGSFLSTLAAASSPGAVSQSGFDEGNAAQYTWLVPEHLSSLAAALGGPAAASSKLEAFFAHVDASASEPYYMGSNEEDLPAPFEFDAFGTPWRTQAVSRRILDRLYADDANGLPGNNDLGEMSSWGVFAMLGLYPEVPGSDVLAIGSPVFPSVTLHLAGGASAVLEAPGAAPDAPYVQQATLGSAPLGQDFVHLAALAGSTLELQMGATPNRGLWTSPGAELAH